MITVRRATANDVTIWQALRREGIAQYPTAFETSLQDHDATPLETAAAKLAKNDCYIAFQHDTPVGIIGLAHVEYPRTIHRAVIFGLYVTAAAQRTGAAQHLVQAVVTQARDLGYRDIELNVNEDNARAIAFYKSLGFLQTNRIPDAHIGVNGPEHDLVLTLRVHRDTTTA